MSEQAPQVVTPPPVQVPGEPPVSPQEPPKQETPPPIPVEAPQVSDEPVDPVTFRGTLPPNTKVKVDHVDPFTKDDDGNPVKVTEGVYDPVDDYPDQDWGHNAE